MGESKSKTEAIQHPLRARILISLNDRHLTPRQIAAQIGEVPLGTVYRHVNILHEAGLIEVVGERRVKGTVERTFATIAPASYLNDEDRQRLTADDILSFVTTLTGVICATFARYVRDAPMPPKPKTVAFLAQSLYLTAEEYEAFREQLVALLGKTGRKAEPGYERRLIGFFSAPDEETVLETD